MADTRPRPPATETDPGGDGQGLQTTEHGVQVHEVPATTTEREFTVVRRSQTQMIIRRFLAHKLAVGSLVVFLLLVIVSLIGGRFWKYGYADITDQFSTPPSLEHPMGTDDIGHDTLAQVLRGSQKSVQVALMVAILATVIGAVIGALAGYYRGWVDSALMRFTDLILTIPAIAILAVLASVVASEAGNWFFIGLVLALLLWVYIARVVRGTFLSLREKEFVEAARMVGANDWRIMRSHVLPHLVAPIVVVSTLIVAQYILAEAGLSFLGLGVKLPTASWGNLLADAPNFYTSQPWLMVWPGLAVLLTTLAFNLMGDGLRDAFDPRAAH